MPACYMARNGNTQTGPLTQAWLWETSHPLFSSQVSIGTWGRGRQTDRRKTQTACCLEASRLPIIIPAPGRLWQCASQCMGWCGGDMALHKPRGLATVDKKADMTEQAVRQAGHASLRHGEGRHQGPPSSLTCPGLPLPVADSDSATFSSPAPGGMAAIPGVSGGVCHVRGWRTETLPNLLCLLLPCGAISPLPRTDLPLPAISAAQHYGACCQLGLLSHARKA